MITEDYVSFETAKLLKDKGFDELCYQKYNSDGELSFNHVGYINSEKPCDDFYALAPTHQMAMKWLREVHKLYINIWADPKDIENYDFHIFTAALLWFILVPMQLIIIFPVRYLIKRINKHYNIE